MMACPLCHVYADRGCKIYAREWIYIIILVDKLKLACHMVCCNYRLYGYMYYSEAQVGIVLFMEELETSFIFLVASGSNTK